MLLTCGFVVLAKSEVLKLDEACVACLANEETVHRNSASGFAAEMLMDLKACYDKGICEPAMTLRN